MGLVLWILFGGLLGWSASALMGIRERQAIDRNVGIAIAGVLFTGWFLGRLIGTSVFVLNDYSLPSLLVALLSAAVVLGAAQLLRIRYFKAIPGLRPLAVAGLALTLMFLAACASAPVAPDSALDAAKVARSNAKNAEAGMPPPIVRAKS